MLTRSKGDADGTSRLRTRRQHAKIKLRLDADAHTPLKPSSASLVAPPARRSRSSSRHPNKSRRNASHDSGEGGGKSHHRTARVHATKSSLHCSPSFKNSEVVKEEDASATTFSASPAGGTGDSPRRQSVRKVVLDKQPKPTTIFRHHLFLEPTLARQAKKRRQKERERIMSSAEKSTGTGDSSAGPSSPHNHHLDDSDNKNGPTRHQQRTNGKDEVEGAEANTPETPFGLRKRSWAMAGMKQREDSPLPCAAKVPRRKMSAVAPGPDRTTNFQVATFPRRSRDEEPLPEGAKELIAQADMARQKKKKPKHSPNRHNSHSHCHFLETEQSPSSYRSGDSNVHDGTFLIGVTTMGKSDTACGSMAKQKKPTLYGPSVKSNHPLHGPGGVVVKRRQYAIDFLASAQDISSIYAGIAVINDLYSGDDFPTSVAEVVIQAQAMGIILLTESLTALLAQQDVQDDLNISSLGARLLVQRMIDHLTVILTEDMSLHPEKMMGLGLTTSEVRLVSPLLRGVLDEIRQMFLDLSEEVLEMEGDHGAT